ncbi:MAG: tRNA (adenosine(37)-N6)-dimethylallyltransferase MiaA [Ruminococcaceae bacterium]|nr:tRNA (adenosine(37)-N6)-dimethylallyltransferase MiaA [Oscillospiraceae bacterium]
MTDQKIKVIGVVGPTASGKSSLALMLAKELDGEIVSCDSMQIYRGMDIGTAKASKIEQNEIKHHMIDIADPDENWSLVDFAAAAHRCIADIAARGKLPVLCGGTGLYMDNILFDTALSEAPGDPSYRQSLCALSCEDLHAMLLKVDDASARAIHPNNRRRVIRALEIYHATGKTKTEWDAASRVKISRYESILLGLRASDRAYLYERIERRVDEMVANGLIKEVNRLAPNLGGTAAQAIGYKEILCGIRGQCTMEQAISDLKTATKRYAKRQMTWFQNNPSIHWLDICGSTQETLLAESRMLLKDFL